MWERFSYYGMAALLALYMVQHLLLPGSIENVAGMYGWRRALEAVFGPQSPQGLASLTFGFYSALVYLTPLFGGWIADRFIGAKRAVLAGALLMTVGHFAMAFEQSFLLALLFIVIGSGFLKGNIASQVGQLYAPEDVTRRTGAFTLFSMSINVGATLGPIVCGLLAQLYGWHVGFGAAGVMMVVATIIYLSGQRHLPDARPPRRERAVAPALTAPERKRVALLVGVIAISICHSVAYDQVYNVGPIWISQHVDLATPWGPVPVPWFISIDPLFSVLSAPLMVLLWARQAKRGREPGDLGKIGIGAGLAALSMGFAAFGQWLAGDGLVPVWVPIIAWAGMGVSFIWYWPPMLALVSRAAPASVNATMMGFVYTSTFFSGVIMGWVGTFYEPLGPVKFWVVNAGIAAMGAGLVLLLGRAISRGLDATQG